MVRNCQIDPLEFEFVLILLFSGDRSKDLKVDVWERSTETDIDLILDEIDEAYEAYVDVEKPLEAHNYHVQRNGYFFLASSLFHYTLS